MKNKSTSNTSLCENSMKMVTKMVKLSSFSLSKLTLGASATQNFASLTASVDMVVDKPPLLQYTGNRSSIEPQSSKKPMLYLAQPPAGNNSSSVICEDDSVDGKASAYIRKVHQKISKETSNHSAYIMPPPPRLVK